MKIEVRPPRPNLSEASLPLTAHATTPPPRRDRAAPRPAPPNPPPRPPPVPVATSRHRTVADAAPSPMRRADAAPSPMRRADAAPSPMRRADAAPSPAPAARRPAQ
jgi:hypothetical protein